MHVVPYVNKKLISIPIDINKWHHIAMTVSREGDNLNTRVYSDGTLIFNDSSATVHEISGQNTFTINDKGNFSYSVIGAAHYNDVRVFKRRLNSAEIQELQRILMIQYDFGEESVVGNTIYDNSGYGHDAIAVGISFENNEESRTRSIVATAPKEYVFFKCNNEDIFNNDFAISFWVKTSGSDTAMYLTNADQTFQIKKEETNKLKFIYNGNEYLFSSSVQEEKWVHIALTAVYRQIALYVNGMRQRLIDQENYVSNTLPYDWYLCGENYPPFTIGNDRMYDFRLYIGRFTDDDILHLYDTKLLIDNNSNLSTNLIAEVGTNNLLSMEGWTIGKIYTATGAYAPSTEHMYSAFIPVLPEVPYSSYINEDYNITFFYYQSNYTFIRSEEKANTNITPENCYYIRCLISNNILSQIKNIEETLAESTPVIIPGVEILTNKTIENSIDQQITRYSSFKIRNICEDHAIGLFNDGTVSCNELKE